VDVFVKEAHTGSTAIRVAWRHAECASAHGGTSAFNSFPQGMKVGRWLETPRAWTITALKAVNGIPAQSTTFLPASLPANPEASFAAISDCGDDNTIYVQFQCARTWSGAPMPRCLGQSRPIPQR
jgi:hypothetical protein